MVLKLNLKKIHKQYLLIQLLDQITEKLKEF